MAGQTLHSYLGGPACLVSVSASYFLSLLTSENERTKKEREVKSDEKRKSNLQLSIEKERIITETPE